MTYEDLYTAAVFSVLKAEADRLYTFKPGDAVRLKSSQRTGSYQIDRRNDPFVRFSDGSRHYLITPSEELEADDTLEGFAATVNLRRLEFRPEDTDHPCWERFCATYPNAAQRMEDFDMYTRFRAFKAGWEAARS